MSAVVPNFWGGAGGRGTGAGGLGVLYYFENIKILHVDLDKYEKQGFGNGSSTLTGEDSLLLLSVSVLFFIMTRYHGRF